MKTIYLVRHGESDSNIGGVILGGAKTALTERGREQAAFVRKRLSRLPVEAIVASTYLRAKQTAEIIAGEIGKPVGYCDLFVEWNMGSHRIGRATSDPELKEQERALVERIADRTWRLGDAEHFGDLNLRAAKALAYLKRRPEEHIVLVGHGMFSRVLLGKAVMGDDFTGRDCRHFIKAFLTNNTGVTILTYDEPSPDRWAAWKVLAWNDHAHLG